ncbi:MAG: gluconate 2-dehydrogenase subunit 3 family protein [Chthoniobacterales bacterium]
MKNTLTRREILSHGLTGMSAAWISAHWPAMLSAAGHARQAANSSAPAKFEFFSPEQAAEIEAISARIIPTTDTAGAHEAGVVFFIDRALVTFAKSQQKKYAEGLNDLQAVVREMFSGTMQFSAATVEQQDHVLHAVDRHSGDKGPFSRSRAAARYFFEMIRTDSIVGFLIDPDSGRMGNRDGVGWKAIGRDPEHMFQPPFGYYDKDYPGWEPASASSDKTKS